MTMRYGNSFEWNLRSVMADRGMYQTTDMQRALSAEGMVLSREQVYRIVTRVPSRLNTDLLVALCRILDCEPNDLISINRHQASNSKQKASGTEGKSSQYAGEISPVPARVRRPKS